MDTLSLARWIIKLLAVTFCLSICNRVPCQNIAGKAPYQDLTHFSRVFGKEKYFRLYLPDDYDQGKDRYPVIYFFHGWGGRYFKDDNARPEYNKINDLVNKYHLILVMWDGNINESDPRPYNVGNHADVKDTVQMKDYFIELVAHIDSVYRTLTDRNNRGIMGFSMGGYMSFFLAGKYPDKVCAAVDLTGSSEFFIGYPANHTLYQLQYTFKNLREVKLLMHNSHDFISKLNEQVYKSALWECGLQLKYKQFAGGHKIDDPGKTERFEQAMKFIVNGFKNPIPKPIKWYHYDLYPEFDVWNYQVKTNKKEPGYIYLKNVTGKGFGIYTLKWLPAGPAINNCKMEVITAPIYQPNANFNIVNYKKDTRVTTASAKSDADGRLHFEDNNIGSEIGIYKTGDGPDMIYLDYTVANNRRYIRVGKENKLSLRIFNRGGEINTSRKVKVFLTPLDSSASVHNESVSFYLKPNERVITVPPFTIYCTKKPPLSLEPPWIKFRIKISIETIEFEDEVMLPVFFDVPVFKTIQIDDGRKIKDSIYGSGNANGIASAGEEIMVYVKGRRARLYTDDPFVETSHERLIDEILPGTAGDGYTLSSVIKINSQCPSGHLIECLASYETKTLMPIEPIERKLTWGRIQIRVNK
jgi:enterochelin esterase-like enzyme